MPYTITQCYLPPDPPYRGDIQGRSQGWAWGAEAPPKRNPSPPPNEFQPMKYPGLAKSAQMYGVIGLIAGNIPTYR